MSMGTTNNEKNVVNDIMEKPKKKSIFGSTKQAKIINIGALVILVGVITWCALYQLHIL